MTNYIQRLEDTLACAGAELSAVSEGVLALQIYLQSPKFREDPTVQVSDVLLRLGELVSSQVAARDRQHEANQRRRIAV